MAEGVGARESAPSMRARLAVALIIATVAVLFPIAEHLRTPDRPSDLGIVWFGARSLLAGVNPFPLVGPGRWYEWDWGLFYPATAMVAALPLAWLTEAWATGVFVWISSAALAFAATRDNWNRVWIFPSAAFIISARTGQWSTILSASFLLPGLSWIWICKPTTGLAMALATGSSRALKIGTLGAILLMIVSLAMLPDWPSQWFDVISGPRELSSPVTRAGGFAILLALLRWRRSEARLLVALALIPLTAAWYEGLPLLLVASTKRENQLLSMISSIGFISQHFFQSAPNVVVSHDTGVLMNAFCYLPATLMVLRRPNDGAAPAWVTALARLARPSERGT